MKEAYYIHGLYCVRLSVSKAQFIWPAHEILVHIAYSKTVLSSHSKKKTKIDYQDQLALNAGQKYCRMLHGDTFDLHLATI